MNIIKIEIKQTVLHLIFRVVITTLFLGLIGCGSDSSTVAPVTTDTNESNSVIKATSLADADVAIYKVKDDGSLSLLWEETTSSGNKLEQIGEFNLHANELTDDDFYLYKVIGGKDWDSDKNAILDKNSTINKGIFRSIAQGVDIKKAGDNFKISYTTELFYEEVVPTLKRKFDRATFPSILNNKVSKIIENSNNIEDILTFNPTEDREKLKYFYKIRVKSIVDDIHQGKIPALNMSTVLGSYYLIKAMMTLSPGYITLSKDNTKAYVADQFESALIIIDISDPTNLTKLGSLGNIVTIMDIVLSDDGNKAYVVNNTGLVVIDISDPTNPSLLSSIDIGPSQSVTLSRNGNKAYIASYDNLIVVDISDSTNPIEIIFYDISTDHVTLSSDGTKAYIANYNSLVVIDISDVVPIKLGSLNTSNDESKKYPDSYPGHVTLSKDGTKAYVTNGMNGLIIVNISDPINLIKLGSYNTTGYSTDVRLSNDETKAYIADGNSGLVVLDISNPANPIKLGSYDTPDDFAQSVTLSSDNTKAYVRTSQSLVIFDISKPINSPKFGSYGTVDNDNGIPTSDGTKANMARVLNTIQNISPILGSYRTRDSDISAITLSSDGTKAYMTSKNTEDGLKELVVVDISNSANLTKLGSLYTSNQSYYHDFNLFDDITLSNDGGKAYVINPSSFVVVDISNPKKPTTLASFNTVDGSYSITLSNDETKAYLTRQKDVIELDISNPTNPIQLDPIYTGSVQNITFSSDSKKIYIGASNGLVMIDIFDSTNPIKIGSSYRGFAKLIALSSDETKAYVTYVTQGYSIDGSFPYSFVVIDISDPTNSIELGSLDIRDSLNSMALSKDGTKVYVANSGNGLLVVDISNPTNPTTLGSYNTTGEAKDVIVSNDGTKAYIADSRNGLVVIDLDLYN